jgi:hypothetical protein
MNKILTILCSFLSLFFVSCILSNEKKEKESNTHENNLSINEFAITDSIKETVIENNNLFGKINELEINEMIQKTKESEKHFYQSFIDSKNRSVQIFAGYIEYDEEKFGFSNPAYIKVLVNNSLIYDSLFKGYENIRLNLLHSENFDGKIDFFTLEYGLEACDYINIEHLYFLNDYHFSFIGEFTYQSTDYASRYPEYYFPSDSGGKFNQIIVIDKIDYRTKEEPNIRDTIIYEYIDQKFNKKQHPTRGV